MCRLKKANVRSFSLTIINQNQYKAILIDLKLLQIELINNKRINVFVCMCVCAKIIENTR